MNKTIISLLLTAALLFSLAACGSQPVSTEPTQAPTQQTTAATESAAPPQAGTPVTFFSLSMGENYDSVSSITVYPNEDGSAHVEYVGQEKKVGDFDASIFQDIANAFVASGLPQLHGQDVYETGDANASMYVDFADGTCAAVGYSGQIPEEFSRGYAAVDSFFQTLVADLPVYIPEPLVMGEVDAELLDEMKQILNGSGMDALDSFTISQIALDESFAFVAGLSSADGIATAVSCAPMMMTTAYSLVIVTLEDSAQAEAVCSDFENNLDWLKWVCVAPSDAMIAQKDNSILCLMAHENLYVQTVAGIENAGWTTVNTLKNPNM